MTISIIKQNDNIFTVKVNNDVSTSHTVTVTNQSLTDLTDNNVTKAQWELELRTVMYVMTQRKSFIGVDTMIWGIGCFSAESVWRTLNRDLRKPTNTVAHGRVRRGELQLWSVTVKGGVNSALSQLIAPSPLILRCLPAVCQHWANSCDGVLSSIGNIVNFGALVQYPFHRNHLEL